MYFVIFLKNKENFPDFFVTKMLRKNEKSKENY